MLFPVVPVHIPMEEQSHYKISGAYTMRYILKLKDFSVVDTIIQKHNIRFFDKLPKLKMLVFEYDPEKDSTDLTLLRAEPSVLYVQPDEIVSLGIADDDEDISSEGQDATAHESTYIAKFGTNQAAEYYSHLDLLNSVNYKDNEDVHDFTTTDNIDGSGVDVYIIDTGVNFSHPRLSGRVYRTPQYDVNLENMQDDDNNGHGTYSALCAAGTECGVARNARIYSLKALGESNSGSAIDLIKAMHEVLRNAEETQRPSVCNMSLGILPKTTNPNVMWDTTGDDHYLNDGAKELVAAGVHVTMSAGNGFYGKKRDTNPDCDEDCDDTIVMGPMMSSFGGGRTNLPKDYANNYDPGQGDTIVVGATQARAGGLKPTSNASRMASFSNYGYGNTVNAVGANLLLPKWNWGIPGASTSIYTFKNGTSFSCPIVAGLVALRLTDKPSELPADTKNWLVSSASYGNIENLAKPLFVTDTKKLSWNTQTAQLTIEMVGSDATGFSEHFVVDDLVQYYFDDSLHNLVNYETWKTEVAEYNDGWWVIDEVADNKIVVSSNLGLDSYTPTGGTTPILKTGANFEFEFSENLTIAKITDTHEETDGIKYWQTLSDTNLLTGAGSRIKEVEYTENLTAFNPYQPYTFDWGTSDGQKPKLVFPDALTNSPLKNIKFKTSRNEVAGETKVTAAAMGSVTVKENGEIETSSEFNLGEATTLSVEFDNGYETHTETLEVVDNTGRENTLTHIKNLVWYGRCGSTNSFDLNSTTQIDSVYQLKTEQYQGSLVWKHDVPSFVEQPFTKLEPGHSYYVILKSTDGSTPDEELEIPNSVVSGVSHIEYYIGEC